MAGIPRGSPRSPWQGADDGFQYNDTQQQAKNGAWCTPNLTSKNRVQPPLNFTAVRNVMIENYIRKRLRRMKVKINI